MKIIGGIIVLKNFNYFTRETIYNSTKQGIEKHII